eukprot:CAMPEP_0174250218 /NCGR_PEP_ID=MMETSP0439-20130205/459_1 /TAXON_ID=0 /ORGANISM="Stereomyxa ramosa, Strain Chinc5" /LENGTH=173 /DNA_ID=CAMNT_0015330229 /DNA_START=31 /DNA_END=552 /DNA_ORIENTATION=+
MSTKKVHTPDPNANVTNRPAREKKAVQRFEFDDAEPKVRTKRARAQAKKKAPAAKGKRGRGRPATKRRKTKKERDPNRPKRAMTAWLLFSTATRPALMKENPDLTLGQSSKELSRLWAECSKAEKAKYEKQAAKDKERYDREMQAYNEKKEEGEEEKELSDASASASAESDSD